MALSQTTLMALTEWCSSAPVIDEDRARGRETFFGHEDTGPVNYLPGAGDWASKERRFLGWFALAHKLPTGDLPSLIAARETLKGSEYQLAVRSLERARFVTAVVRWMGRSSELVLEVDDGRIEIRSPHLTRVVNRDGVVVCHVVPTGGGRWLLGPGWTVLPFRYGPGIQEHLSQFQWHPIDLERFLQGRSPGPDQERPRPVSDQTLAEAVARMNIAATAAGREKLALSADEWTALVQPFLANLDATGFSRELLKRLGEDVAVEEANKWLHLAMNIWNNTPQPDRGGKSANELAQEGEGPMTLRIT